VVEARATHNARAAYKAKACDPNEADREARRLLPQELHGEDLSAKITVSISRVSARRTTWNEEPHMARWPRHAWTTLFTYGSIFILFPLLGYLAMLWVRGR
jgi:hypothetical protein